MHVGANIVRRRWRAVAWIMVLVLAGTLPWMLLTYDVAHGLAVGRNASFEFFIRNSEDLTNYIIPRWNQQVSLAAALDEFMSEEQHLRVRYALAGFAVLTGGLLFWRKQFGVAVVACTLWFFFLYGRGFEYHVTLYVPMLLYLYTLEGGRYRGGLIVLIALLVALPTTYPLYRYWLGLTNPAGFAPSSDAMFAAHRGLYYAFLWQRPVGAFLLLGLVLVKEWPWCVGFLGRVRTQKTPASTPPTPVSRA